MDEELGALARKNLPKFQQLNQRMQVCVGGVPPASGATTARARGMCVCGREAPGRRGRSRLVTVIW